MLVAARLSALPRVGGLRALGGAAALERVAGLRELTRQDIIPVAEYEALRAELRPLRVEQRRVRRALVGPHASVSFESSQLVWMQIQEMLWVERSVGAAGGDAFEEQVADELEAYRPLVPTGDNLVATLMFEIGNKRVRERELSTMGGVESSLELVAGSLVVPAQRVHGDEVERFEVGGKTSAVHFLQFPGLGSAEARAALAQGPVQLRFAHERYPHSAGLAEETVAALLGDVSVP